LTNPTRHLPQLILKVRNGIANSAVCYSLRITAVDPVGIDLLFDAKTDDIPLLIDP
jgi:hypothetical protein